MNSPRIVSFIVGWVFCTLFLFGSIHADSEVKFKILAVNPSADQSLKAVIDQPLPAEIDPTRDIVDKAGLEIVYDAEAKGYKLTGGVELQPRETKTFEVRIRDVWQISVDQAEEVRKELDAQIAALKGTKYYETAKLLYDKAQEGIDRILEEQSKPMGISQHIELYRSHVLQLQDIKSNAISLSVMRKTEEEQKKGIPEARFVIDAENPSSESRSMRVRSVLPKELRAEDVLDRQGFSVLYDQLRKAYVLEKDDQFSAREKKTYVITVRDIWRVSDEEIGYHREQTEQLVAFFEGTAFEKYAADQGAMILDILNGITQLQAELNSSLALEDRMRAFVLNTQQMNIAKEKIRNLQHLMVEVSPKKSDHELLEKIKHFVKKLAEVKDVVLMAMGVRPDTPIVWWIIFGIIIFLGIVSVVFYMIWIKRLREEKWGPKEKGKVASPPPSPEPPVSDEPKTEQGS
ncbi:MAG: hypothetical protein ACOYJW_03820 [Candidatus Omnitrophota bacterium]|jgi:hypothetical protein